MGRGLVSAFVVIAILAFPVASFAQEAAIGGTVKDSTSGVLPGVAIQAVHEATGTVFETVTDERGLFRLPVRIGTFRIGAVLQGFTTIQRTGIEVLVVKPGPCALNVDGRSMELLQPKVLPSAD